MNIKSRICIVIVLFCLLPLTSCAQKPAVDLDKIFTFADEQTKRLLSELDHSGTEFPRSMHNDKKLKTNSLTSWTNGYFPGSLWYLYEYTKDQYWKDEALLWTHKLEPIQHYARHHDIGLVMYCSYGNANRILGNDLYKDVLVTTSKTLCSRFMPKAGIIRSWDRKISRKGTVWNCPVIIDNMMVIEILFYASKVTGDDYYKNIAITHANTTMKNHIRPDYSSYHVVNYDTVTGAILDKDTYQGFAKNSTWSRGQSWGIYGFTMMYRETKDAKYLETARKMADFFINHPNLPKDMIPYWDFNVEQPGYVSDYDYDATRFANGTPRDVSAAAVTCSGLIELSSFLGKDGKKYLNAAEKMLQSMSSPQYTSKAGENANFILDHYVGNMPVLEEVDKPSVYADYYYLEALLRYKRLLEGKKVVD